MLRSLRWLLVGILTVVPLSAATAQEVSASDLTRLEESIDATFRDLATLRERDRAAARALQDDVIELDEEVTYLKVQLRRGGDVSRSDYNATRERIEDVRARITGHEAYRAAATSSGSTQTTARQTTRPGVIPAGTELDVRLERRLSSETARVEDRFEATTVVDLRENGKVLIPDGSRVRGVVTDVKSAGRLDRTGELKLSFDQITVNGRNYPLRATVTQALKAGGYREDAEKIGAGAAVGAILGGILGGVRGALTGILIGGGGVIAATEGEDVELPEGTVLRIRLDSDLDLNRSTR